MRALLTAALVLMLPLAGCGGPAKVDKSPMKMEDVPANVVKAAKEKHPDVNFTEAFKEGPNYELRGKTKAGKTIEIDITPDGKVTAD